MDDMNYVWLKVPMSDDEYKCWKQACKKTNGFAYNYLRKIIFSALENDFGIIPTERWEYPINKILNKKKKH